MFVIQFSVDRRGDGIEKIYYIREEEGIGFVFVEYKDCVTHFPQHMLSGIVKEILVRVSRANWTLKNITISSA